MRQLNLQHQVCRGKIKDAIKIIMSKQESDLHDFVAEFKKEFKQLPPEAIAFPRSCNNLRKYRDNSSIFIKAHQFT